ncbi:hypothetical protein QYE76_011481 [Lolium multiflorum]|uniref:2-(3-amino-3-carboxypropyl)histidine synthase n=1 Tax=Lolium multiflorum TaxID=4521 RepID=A0AAD8TZK6_LOLMU|nr:hypothetical protein QYE76_011481 [Lolium multiflorum]
MDPFFTDDDGADDLTRTASHPFDDDDRFPDELLKDAAPVARALRRELGGGGGTKLFVMADIACNSCCVDEVGASAIDAQCVVHYGHSYMSP